MSNPKVFEFAKEIGMTPLALMDKIREWQIPVKSHMAELQPEVLEQIKVKLRGPAGDEEQKVKKTVARKAATKKSTPEAPAAVASAAVAPTGKTSAVVRRKAKDPTEDHPKVENVEAKESSAAVIISRPPVKEEVPVAKEVTPVVVPPVADAPKEKAPAPEISVAPAKEVVKPAVVVEEKKPAAPVASNANAVAASSAPSAAAVSASSPSQNTNPASAPAGGTPAANSALGPSRKKEVVVGTSGVQSASTPVATGRKNIVGRMDLSRVQQPQYSGGGHRPAGGGGGQYSGGSGGGMQQRPGGAGGGGFGSSTTRPGANRNIRAGFVAQPVFPDVVIEDDSKNRKTVDKRSKKLDSATVTISAKEKELEEMQEFNAVEFRKREMVFQPKKKKGLLNRESIQTQITKPKASKRVVKVFGSMKVSDLAQEMGLKAAQLIKALMSNGVMANMNTELDFDTIALIVPEFQWEAQNIQKSAEEVVDETAFGDLTAEAVPRPPVVTIMGHVDHGKTSLLDAIRSAKVAAGEAGGITQHIGAYSVKLEDGHVITFLDTPGHEAFTAMRARGANATDIAVIVVAADDGMMPQTQEAISHAKAAKVPIIVAVNKMDKPGANPDRIKQQLTEMELVPEEWGGTTIYVPVSALKKTGIDELLQQIHLVAEMQELRANPKRSGTGIVIEAKLEKGKGPVATLLVKDGTVKIGQNIVAGVMKGRVRSMTNDRGERVEEVGPGFPIEVLGLESTPSPGDRFDVVIDEATAEKAVSIRKDLAEKAAQSSNKKSLEEIFSKANQGDVKELSVILKTDVQGSLEAILGMLAKLSTPEVKLKVIHSAVGGVNESDILLAQTAKGVVIGFNVRPDAVSANRAKQLGIEVRTYTIVYEMIDEMKRLMGGLLTPDIVEKVTGRAEVRNTFTVPKIGTIAGCFIVDGKIQRTNQARLIRDGKIVYEGKLGSLKRFKDDAKEVAQGFECGIGIENYNDVKVGDIIESFIKEEVARELTSEAKA